MKNITRWLRKLPTETLCVYPDGSSTRPAYSVYGHTIYKYRELIASGGIFLPGAEVYDAEIAGAVRDLEAASQIGNSIGIKVLLNSQEAVEGLESGRINSSLQEVKK